MGKFSSAWFTMLIRVLVVLLLCTCHGVLNVNANEIPDTIEDQDQLQAVEENNLDDEAVRQAPPPPEEGSNPTETPPLPPPEGAPTEAPPPPPPEGAPNPTDAPLPAPAPSAPPPSTEAPPPSPEDTSLEVPNTLFKASKENAFMFILVLKIKPETPDDLRFIEGEEKVKIGESTKSLNFKEGKMEDGLLLIPVQVTDHKDQKIKFKVEFKGKTKEITVNVEGDEKPAFELLKNEYETSEDVKWTFTVEMKAEKKLDYKFTEGDKSASPGEKTMCLQFGNLTKMAENNEYHIPVEVIDLSPNNITFSITAEDTTEEATVNIEPPRKPLLLNKEFEVNKKNDFTFVLKIKSMSMPSDLKFTEGNSTVAPGGEDTDSFHFGQLTNDIPNLYTVEVKTTNDIDEPRQFEVLLNGESITVEVSKESESSAMSTAPLTYICILIPILLMLLR